MSEGTVLLIDDNRLYRKSLGDALRHRGCHVIEATTAGDGLSRLGEGIDLVLLEQRLPDANGIELLDRIRSAIPGRPIILLTAFPDPEIAREAIRRGVYEYLDKLDTHEHVLSVAQRALQPSWLSC